jgi:hypothetical protein
MAISVLGAVAQAQAIAHELGLDGWQRQTGTYNGVAFHVVPSVLDRLNQDLNPAAGIIDATENLLGITSNSQDNTSLPYGTHATGTAIADETHRKLVIHRPPNNADIFEDQGWFGDTFSIQGILYGAAYSQALNNILNAFLNDSNISNSDRNVLVHPILGRIENVMMISKRQIHDPKMWRCCLYQFTFVCTKPVATLAKNISSTLNSITSGITSILSIITGLLNTWGEIKAIQNTFGSSGNTSSVQNALKNSQAAVISTCNISVSITQFLVNNLQPPGYNNVQLSKTKTTPIVALSQLYYFSSNMTPTDVNTLLTYSDNSIDDCIAVLQTVNDNPIYDSITALINLQSQINGLALALLNSFYGSTKLYTTPYDTNLFDICFLNNLNYNTQSSTILKLNQSVIFSTNFIAKHTSLRLPLSTNPNTSGAL